MYRIGIISIYFGPFPNYFSSWLCSCGLNPSIDFILITDQVLFNVPPNVNVVSSDLESVKIRFEEALGHIIKMDKPYKLCDLKPMYGIAFEEYLKEYDFWGHCDIDLIWGDLRKFITPDILDKYDKVLSLGHLSLYRNTRYINEAFKLPGSLRGNYEEVISTNRSCVFDECYGINEIFKRNKLPIYENDVVADIGFRNQRMIIASNQICNFPYQVFYVENGRCMRAYIENDEIKHDEFAYIHLQKRKYENIPTTQSYIVGQNRFYEMQPITMELIQGVNPYYGKLYEQIEYFYKDYRFRISRRLRQLFMK